MTQPRLLAYQLLLDWETNKTFPNLALKEALRRVPDLRDRRFITALVYGVAERKLTLDHFIRQCTAGHTSAPVRTALRMGIYQLFYMNVPPAAACHSTVALVKERNAYHAGFVNAVLRRCDREREQLLLLKKADFSVRYSISPALVELLLAQYGKEAFVSMMEGMKTPDPSVYLFHNTRKGSEADFLALMREEGIALQKTALPHLFQSDHGFAIEDSPGFRQGWYHIVGYHSAMAALMMLQGTALALDLCAAPGGKTFILAAGTDGAVTAFDIHPHKISLLTKSAARLGHKNVTAQYGDSAVYNPDLADSADFVLCDVPCSGLGMMAKKPDIKYRDALDPALSALQKKILENGGRYTKPGGRLVYSTCTIDRRENEEQVAAFLQANPRFSRDTAALPEGERLFLPEQGGDGFYIAVLKKG